MRQILPEKACLDKAADFVSAKRAADYVGVFCIFQRNSGYTGRKSFTQVT